MTARLRPTWVPEQARRYRQAGRPLGRAHPGRPDRRARRRGGRRCHAALGDRGRRACGHGRGRPAGARGPARRGRVVAGPQQPGGRRPDPGLLAHRRRGGARPALVRLRGRGSGPRPDRPRPGPGARCRGVLRPRRSRRRGRRRPGARRRLSQPALRRRPGPVHLGLDRGPQGSTAHPARPELEGLVDGAGARPRPGRCGADAGADGPHLGPAQRGPRAGRRRPALGPRSALRPRAGTGTRGARAHLLPGGPADILHRHGPRPGRGAGHRRVVDTAGVQRRRLGDPGLRGGHGAHLRLPRQTHVRLDRGADSHHEHRRRPVREGPRHRRTRRGRGRAPRVGCRDGRALRHRIAGRAVGARP